MAETAGRRSVLVVDDEPLNRDLLRRFLGRDFDVLEAEDAMAALALLGERSVDVVICDHLMPGRSGTELAHDIRARWPDLAVLLLTGYDDAPEVEAAVRDGAILEVIAKPWAAARLRASVAKAMAGKV